jgi:outer membrane biosynthesis protein TonB
LLFSAGVVIPVMEPPIREGSPSPPAPDVPPPMLDGELHLLIGDLKEDIARYRRREAAWISLAVHAVFILLLIFVPKWLPESAVVVAPAHENKDVTFVPLPDDQLKIKTPPKTDIISDKNRVAQTRTPQPDRETLKKLLDAEKAGRPKPEAAPPQPQAQQQAAQVQQAPPAQQAAQAAPAEPQETAKLQVPAQPKPNNPFAIASAGSSVDQAIRAAANSPGHSRTEFERSGHYGSGLRPKIDAAGAFDILSDTQGVDFGPYMKRLKVTVQQHWDPLIPESAMPPMMKKGRVVIEFAIMKDGTIMGMRMISGSGDVALDRAAWGALTSSIPLDRLPVQYTSNFLLIRAAFYYNPDKNDFE